MSLNRFLSISLILFIHQLVQAQESKKDRTGFSYGAGFYGGVASNKNAMFYNGSPDKVNNIASVFNIQTNYEEVQMLLNDDFKVVEYPSKMNYNPALGLIGNLGYYFTNNQEIYTQIAFSRLHTDGQFVLELASPAQNNIDTKNYVNGDIVATESRFDIEIGYHLRLTETKKYNPFVECAGNINIVNVLTHTMSVSSFSRSLISASTYSVSSNQKQGGTGAGISLAFGYETQLKPKMYCSFGIHGSMKKIHLLSDASLTPHADLFLRFTF